MSEESLRLSIIIPTLDESERLGRLLEDVAKLELPHEVVVADGGSTDRTVEIASQTGARVTHSAAGRGAQLRAGVGAANAPWLLVVHADCRIPSSARHALLDFLRDARDDDFAHFEFALEGDEPFWRFIELGQRLREGMYGLVYGDQGLLVSRALYESVGGYEHWPVMEDVGLFDRLKRAGNARRLSAPLVTSPRRYEERGRWSQWLSNVMLITLFRLGADPKRLARSYPGRRSRGEQGAPNSLGEPPEPVHAGQTIILFAKAPRLGFVKTRLARDVGEAQALQIYRALGSRAVDVARRTQRQVIIYYTPSDAESELRSWLGSAGLEFYSQTEGDLGERMDAAFAATLPDRESVCIVGMDVPGLTPTILGYAFDALAERDVVLGPAEDGGYYLIGLCEPRPELFEDVPWSTDTVFDVTSLRAREEGLSVAVIERLADVDTVDDLPVDLPAGLPGTTPNAQF